MCVVFIENKNIVYLIFFKENVLEVEYVFLLLWFLILSGGWVKIWWNNLYNNKNYKFIEWVFYIWIYWIFKII